MKVIGFNGQEYTLSLNKHKREDVSSYHLRCRTLLRQLFPNNTSFEEVILKGSKRYNKPDLIADFFIVSHKIIIEINGEQHYEQNSFFHDSKLDFLDQKKRDRRKEEWSQINDIIYVELRFDETEEQWKNKILLNIAN